MFAISLLKAKNPNRTVKWATLNQSHHFPLLELELCERENTIRDGNSTALAAACTVYMYCLHCVLCLLPPPVPSEYPIPTRYPVSLSIPDLTQFSFPSIHPILDITLNELNRPKIESILNDLI